MVSGGFGGRLWLLWSLACALALGARLGEDAAPAAAEEKAGEGAMKVDAAVKAAGAAAAAAADSAAKAGQTAEAAAPFGGAPGSDAGHQLLTMYENGAAGGMLSDGRVAGLPQALAPPDPADSVFLPSSLRAGTPGMPAGMDIGTANVMQNVQQSNLAYKIANAQQGMSSPMALQQALAGQMNNPAYGGLR
eukprot:TRINITY_DN10014_c0_g2_i1.p1 TRINITY_DN10014_c0_g2~~TRINITY_DN10014_c0_g2_i1.p1  ORF type:complete len:191 (+),score=54.69 TRINITY_DN10014_c0_g2_i1:80-652(+)